jgi:hypothetical protein
MHVAGGWIRLHNEEPHNLYASSNIMVMKSRKMRWAGHTTCVGEMINACTILVRKPERKSEDEGVDG